MPTHTSMQTNSSIYSFASNRTFRVIDVPGHPRIRNQFQEYLLNAKAIAFIVDASTISRNGAAVAECAFLPYVFIGEVTQSLISRHLHTVLHSVTSLPPSQNPPFVLIIAHKADLLKSGTSALQDSLAINRVKSILERELEKRRASRIRDVTVESLGEENEKGELGGLECGNGTENFKFDDWEGGQISFISTYVRPGGDDVNSENGLSKLRDWLVGYM